MTEEDARNRIRWRKKEDDLLWRPKREQPKEDDEEEGKGSSHTILVQIQFSSLPLYLFTTTAGSMCFKSRLLSLKLQNKKLALIEVTAFSPASYYSTSHLFLGAFYMKLSRAQKSKPCLKKSIMSTFLWCHVVGAARI